MAPKKPRIKSVSRSITKKNTKAVSRLTKKTSTTAAPASTMTAPQPMRSLQKNNTKTKQNSTDTNSQISRTIPNATKYHGIDKILGKRIVNNQVCVSYSRKGFEFVKHGSPYSD